MNFTLSIMQIDRFFSKLNNAPSDKYSFMPFTVNKLIILVIHIKSMFMAGWYEAGWYLMAGWYLVRNFNLR